MISPTGIWDQETADAVHPNSCSPNLAKWMEGFLPKENVIDFGCGNAYYISELQKSGFNCMGVEGAQLNNFLHPIVHIVDLSKPCEMNMVGSVICLEIGEHVPQEFEQTFINNITKHCRYKLVLSWAVPNQDGIGHVNLRPNEYIINEIERRRFKYLPEKTLEARSVIENHVSYFRNTLMVFEKI